MRLMACFVCNANGDQEFYVNSEHTGPWPPIHWNEVLDHFEHTDGCMLSITTYNASSNHSITWVPQSTLEAFGIGWSA
jgi:hypothetical protein